MDIPNLTSPYGDLYANAKNQAASKLESELKSDYSKATDEELMDACKQFEAYMIQQMFKSMEESAKVFSDDDEDSSGDYVEMFQDNYLSTIAEQMVNRGQGLGIAEQLYDSINQNKI